MNKDIYIEKLYEAINEYFQDIQQELIERWNSWDLTMENKQLYEVIGGLLSRQVALTTYFLQSSTNWNSEFSPIIFRVLFENYLNLSYILHSNSLEKAKQFIDFGLGREKLHWEKIKKEAKSQNKFEEQKQLFKDSDDFWNQFKYFEMQDINLSQWTNLNMREVAISIDEKELYDFIDTMNDAVHGTFNQLVKHNLKKSDNPLHQYILVPSINAPKPNIEYAESAAAILDKAFLKVDKYFPPNKEIISSASTLVQKIDLLTEEMKIAFEHTDSFKSS